jgi:hypothetical protein
VSSPKPITQEKPKKKLPPAAIVLNVLIVLLSGVILFMSYSIYLKIKSNSDSAETDVKKAADIVQLEVLNGCGSAGVAEKFTDYLRSRNFDVVSRGNYRSFEIDNSFIIDRTGNTANAEKVADALGIDKKNIVQQLNEDYFLDVSLVIGRDFNKLKPLK